MAGAMAQQSGALAALLDLSTVPSTSMGCLITAGPSGSRKSRTSANTYTHTVDTQIDTTAQMHKYETNLSTSK